MQLHLFHCAISQLACDIPYSNIGRNGTESSSSVVMERLAMSPQPEGLIPPLSLCLSVLITLTFSPHAFLFPFCSFLSLALAEINRRYLTLMWEHNVSCSVKTTFVSATVLFARGNCAPLSCEAAWRYSCCPKKGSDGRGEFRAMWKWKECVVLACDTRGGLYD